MSEQMVHSVASSTLADVLERVLDKGIVIAGDIKIKLVDIELLTIQLRLIVASVDKAREIGIDWWTRNPNFSATADHGHMEETLAALGEKVSGLERRFSEGGHKPSDRAPSTVAVQGRRKAPRRQK